VMWNEVHFDLQVLVTNWLSAWRVYRDHCTATFPKRAPQYAKLDAVRHAEFDGSPAYRLAENMRDYVTHVGLPPIHMTVSEHLDEEDKARRTWKCWFNPQQLLEDWDRWKSPAKRDLVARIELTLAEIVDDVMQAAQRIEATIQTLRPPQLRRSARSILRAAQKVEDQGGAPCLLKLHVDGSGALTKMTPIPLPTTAARELLA
jgi:hypothetical protein